MMKAYFQATHSHPQTPPTPCFFAPSFSLAECGAARLVHCGAQRSAGGAAAERRFQEAWLSGPRVRHTLNMPTVTSVLYQRFMSAGVQMNSSVRCVLPAVLIRAGNAVRFRFGKTDRDGHQLDLICVVISHHFVTKAE